MTDQLRVLLAEQPMGDEACVRWIDRLCSIPNARDQIRRLTLQHLSPSPSQEPETAVIAQATAQMLARREAFRSRQPQSGTWGPPIIDNSQLNRRAWLEWLALETASEYLPVDPDGNDIAWVRAGLMPLLASLEQPGTHQGQNAPDAFGKEERAMACLAKHPDWTNKQIAEAAGVHEKTLYRWPRFKKARAISQSGREKYRRTAHQDSDDDE